MKSSEKSQFGGYGPKVFAQLSSIRFNPYWLPEGIVPQSVKAACAFCGRDTIKSAKIKEATQLTSPIKRRDARDLRAVFRPKFAVIVRRDVCWFM